MPIRIAGELIGIPEVEVADISCLIQVGIPGMQVEVDGQDELSALIVESVARIAGADILSQSDRRGKGSVDGIGRDECVGTGRVTMQEPGVSRLVSVDLDAAVKMAAS